jgi:hypothetical protein
MDYTFVVRRDMVAVESLGGWCCGLCLPAKFSLDYVVFIGGCLVHRTAEQGAIWRQVQ